MVTLLLILFLAILIVVLAYVGPILLIIFALPIIDIAAYFGIKALVGWQRKRKEEKEG